jgi:hypothetical protein
MAHQLAIAFHSTRRSVKRRASSIERVNSSHAIPSELFICSIGRDLRINALQSRVAISQLALRCLLVACSMYNFARGGEPPIRPNGRQWMSGPRLRPAPWNSSGSKCPNPTTGTERRAQRANLDPKRTVAALESRSSLRFVQARHSGRPLNSSRNPELSESGHARPLPRTARRCPNEN